jgi:GTP-binding protein
MTANERSEGGETRVTEAEFVAGAPAEGGLPPPALAEVAFAGRSNVGKSSLLNAMMQRRALARTSGTPGCTRQINVFHVKALPPGGEGGALDVHFVDLPGYGYAKRAKSEKAEWGPMLEGYLQRRVTLRAVALLVDVRRGLEDDDVQLIDFLRAPRLVDTPKPLEIAIVATKIDKLPKNERKPALEKLKKTAKAAVVGFSAVTGEGREELWSRIRRAVL